MAASRVKREAETTGPLALRLEMTDQKGLPPLSIPVTIRNLSMEGVTLAVANPWVITDWDSYHGEDCVLRVEGPGDQDTVNLKARIAWTKSGGTGQSPLSLGLEMVNPPGEALGRLRNFLTHTSRDIKGLWDRYDQVRQIPERSHLVHHCYIAGLVLLLGGLVLQFTGSPPYKMWGWVLWLLGSLGIAGEIVWPYWQKRASGDQFGKTL
jgi:PilZ domain